MPSKKFTAAEKHFAEREKRLRQTLNDLIRQVQSLTEEKDQLKESNHYLEIQLRENSVQSAAQADKIRTLIKLNNLPDTTLQNLLKTAEADAVIKPAFASLIQRFLPNKPK